MDSDLNKNISLNNSNENNRYGANAGEMNDPQQQNNYPDAQIASKYEQSTLDEPITTTLLRDFKVIMEKIKIAMLPMKAKETSDAFKDWDFWGPLFLCLLLGLILSIGRTDTHTGTVFILIFAIVWIGGLIISLNSQFLGTKLTVFQCICILGYCMCGIVIAALINYLTPFFGMFIHLIIALAGFGYSSYGKFIIIIIYSFRCICWTSC